MMHDHDKYIELISRALDGDTLSESETAELNAHLDVCPDCRDFYDAMCEISGDIAGDEVPAPPSLLPYVTAKVAQMKVREAADRKRARRRSVIRRTVSAAACLCLILVAMPLMPDLGCGSSDRAPGEPPAANEAADSAEPAETPMEQVPPAEMMPAPDSEPDTDRYGWDGAMDKPMEPPTANSPTDNAPDMPEAPREPADPPAIDESGKLEGAGYTAKIEKLLQTLREQYDEKYAFVFVVGQLPEQLQAFTPQYLEDGVDMYIVPSYVADVLSEMGHSTYYDVSTDGDAVVVYIK